jgi:hypothetical protein
VVGLKGPAELSLAAGGRKEGEEEEEEEYTVHL